VNVSQAVKALTLGLNNLIAAEPNVTKYDTMVGDGDCGLCLKTGAEAVLAHVSKSTITDAVQFVSQIALVVESSMDGTSGATYAIFLNALAYSLSLQDRFTKHEAVAAGVGTSPERGSGVLRKVYACQTWRSHVNALQPFLESMVKTQDFVTSTEAAKKGCESTEGMEASLGRTVYIGGDDWKKCPDPGAYGLVESLLGMSRAF
jgi:dihydroxyacetone kinase